MSVCENSSSRISEVAIREFQAGDEAAFKRLNAEWIERYFRVEPEEAAVLEDPKATILDRGGRIFFAVVEGRCAGCCALRRLSETEFEVAKMAVTPSCQGAGVGRRLLRAVIAAGRNAGARRLYLETNHRLKPAIHLYESMGFRHLSPDEIVPSPYERADVYMELIFD